MTFEDTLRAIVRSEIREALGDGRPGEAAAAPPLEDVWLSVAKAAELGSFAPETILDHIDRGNLPAVKPKGSREWRIRLVDFRTFMGWRERGPAPVLDIKSVTAHVLGRAANGGGK